MQEMKDVTMVTIEMMSKFTHDQREETSFSDGRIMSFLNFLLAADW